MTSPNHFVGKRIANNRIELVDIIGEGSYGCVYRAILHEDGTKKLRAVKCLSKANLDAYHLMCQRREILLHQQVSDGEGIVTLYEAFEDSDFQWLVLEYSSDGDLWEGISEGCYAGKDDIIKDIFGQILEAVEYCHSKHVFHRDLKPENVLLTNRGSKVLLADFGLASGSPVSNELRCGSPWYMSPGAFVLFTLAPSSVSQSAECWGGIFNTNEPYATAPNDIWCLGILLINLACGRHAPWKHATTHDTFFRDFTRQPGMLRLLLPLSSQVHDLLGRVFMLTPAARISIQEFRAAVAHITSFAIPADERAAFHDTQRAVWSAALGPTSSHPLSTDIVRIVPITTLLHSMSTEGHVEDEGVDITDAVNRKEYCIVKRKKSTHSFICHIPIIDTSPNALRCNVAALTSSTSSSSMLLSPTSAFRTPSSSSRSGSTSADSLFPVTPQMVATMEEVDVEIIDMCDIPEDVVLPPPPRPGSPGSSLAIGLGTPKMKTKVTDGTSTGVFGVGVPFQSLLRALRGL
jgi:serine/threonine protein kinase